jgi:hypothetical protein
MDESKAFYHALGNREQNMDELKDDEIKLGMKTAGQAATDRGFEQNMDGEGTLLGGVVVFDANGKFVFAHREERWGDDFHSRTIEELTKACKKSPKL